MGRRGKGRGMRLESRRHGDSLIKLTIAIFLLFVATAIAFEAYYSLGFEGDNVIVVDDPSELLSAIPSEGVAVVYFKQDNCPGCKKIEPALERYIAENRDKLFIVAYLDGMLKKDVEETLELLGRLAVPGTPTLIVYRDGVEVGRHIGTFGLGEQYEPMKEFFTSALEGDLDEFREKLLQSGVVITGVDSRATDPIYASLQLTTAFVLGIIAALSPCSLPMVLVFASLRTNPDAKFKVFINNAVGIAALAAILGFAMSILYVVGAAMPVNVYTIILALAASFIGAWGIESLRGREPVLLASPRVKRFLPLIGLQCSLPFLLAMISIISTAPHIVLGASFMFAAGYSLPYAVAASIGGGIDEALNRLMSRGVMIRIQGVFLVGAAAYVLYNSLTALI